MRKLLVALLLCGTLAACSKSPTVTSIPGVKIGKPYTISGKTYHPKHDPNYNEVGIASWYGPGFHGKKTANGEIFDQDDLTAAHPTLPMPSMVRVTNLSNGKSAVVRVNDRGPFKANRIIDLSRGTAQKLGVSGLAEVRVEFLRAETEKHWASLGISTKKLPKSKDDGGFSIASITSNGSMDGTYVPASNAQVESSAPVLSVSSVDLQTASRNSNTASPAVLMRGTNVDEVDAPLSTQTEWEGVDERADAADELSRPEIETASYAARASPELPSSEGNFYVQAGAFASEKNAKALSKRIKDLGNVQLVSFLKENNLLHRVRVGPFFSRADASSLLSILRTRGIQGAAVVWE